MQTVILMSAIDKNSAYYITGVEIAYYQMQSDPVVHLDFYG